MSISTLILGESGTGKSASLRNMPPEDTLLIQTVRKPLPFRAKGWSERGPGRPGNVFVTDNSNEICQLMHRTQRRRIIVDDFQYMLANEFMRRSDERGYDKFTDIGRHAWDVLNFASNIPDGHNKRVYILAHTSSDEFGKTRMKTIGRMLDEKITPEGLFSIVLRTHVDGPNYQFRTRNSGSDTVKSPIGLFAGDMIDNDLQAVDEAICAYYELSELTPA